MRRNTLIGIFMILTVGTSCIHGGYHWKSYSGDAQIEKRVDSVLALMTYEEKIGQITQYSVDTVYAGQIDPTIEPLLKKGLIGRYLNVTSSTAIREIQDKLLEESRLKIPALFALNVSHGFKTVFPMTLAQSCTWDPDLIEQCAAIASAEASATGINWSILPEVDTLLDACGKYVMEGYGENHYLASLLSAARLRGFQGDKLDDLKCLDKILAFNDSIYTDGFFQKRLLLSIKEEREREEIVDNAVRCILEMKYLLGIMDDPFRYLDVEREKATMMKPEFLETARDAGRKSVVLLKNDMNFFPISTTENKTVALIGPMVKEECINSGWTGHKNSGQVVSLFEGLEEKYKNTNVRFLYAEGYSLNESGNTDFAQAITVARQADVILVALGGELDWSTGVACSTDIGSLPAHQRELLKELKKIGRPIGLVLMTCPPLELCWETENVEAIVVAWYLGTMGGHAIADVISGDYNPAGKLTMSFSHSCETRPLFPFGHGLSYTDFEIDNLKLDKSELRKGKSLAITVDVTNTGKRDGEEVVQLYIRNMKDDVSRSMKELKDFRKVFLKAGEKQQVAFRLSDAALAPCEVEIRSKVRADKFQLWVGTSSADEKNETTFVNVHSR